MAIQPIDLQTMYSQMTNVANRVSHEQQSVQTGAQLAQQNAVVQNQREMKSVTKMASEESKTGLVKEDGHQNQQEKRNASQKNKEQETETPKKDEEIFENYLGKHINITR